MRSTYLEKPLTHYTWDAWESYNNNLSSITKFKYTTANNVQQDGKQLRADTKNTISWKLRDTNFRLTDRITDIDQWYRNLERTAKEVKDQIDRLAEAKCATEQTYFEELPLLEATKECLHLQEKRREIDLVEDDVYNNLVTEMNLLDVVCNQLREKAHADWEQLVNLKEALDALNADMKDKNEALKIDTKQLSLHIGSIDISFKPWPLEIPEGSITELQWLDHSVANRARAEAENSKGMMLTNSSWALIRDTNNDILKQRDSTQYALRRRQHETLHQRDKLDAQKRDLMNEVARTDAEMRRLEAALYDTRAPLKLSHTRLENRKWRPRMDLCSDYPQKGLVEEVTHLVESQESLKQQLRDTRNVLNGLQQHLDEVTEDLIRKERSLQLETKCLEIHTIPNKAPYQTELAWLSDNSYIMSSLERGANERILALKQPTPKSTTATMTESAPAETELVD